MPTPADSVAPGPVSMTGYAAGQGALADWRWTWDMRGVNGRGLDLRFRLPDWIDGLEPALRALAQARMARGNVTIALRVTREAEAPVSSVDSALDQVAAMEEAAMARGISLAPCRATDLLALRPTDIAAPPDPAPLRAALIAAFADDLLPSFTAMRHAEGAALAAILTTQIDAVAALIAQAARTATARDARAGDTLRAAVERLIGAGAADPGRLAQELALLAVKADVTEEIDRLRAHVAAARDLLGTTGPVGRKLDFLTQEFNREANTLCSKAQDSDLTAIGLDLKTRIDQMREQVQNVE